ncbi:MAG: riboflavin kinase [Clostridia bacterium]
MEKPLWVLHGVVGHGRGKGRKVGMPTANLLVADGQELPALGVYASACKVDGESYWGVTNVGTRPSVDGDLDVTVETFLLDFAGDLYGRVMELVGYLFLRPVVKMESLEAVHAQVEKDAKRANAYFSALAGKG